MFSPETLPSRPAACFLAVLLALASMAHAQSSDSPEPVYVQDQINPMLGRLDPPPVLETPQSAFEFFMLACEDDDFARAAHALNFRLNPQVSPDEAARLAEQLFFVINQELWIDWESLPDRPDGMDDSAPLNGSGPMIGRARKSIPIGSIDLGSREVTLRLQRVTTDAQGETPRWLISPFTVEHIEAMYEAHGPGWLDDRMPEWARVRGWGGVMVWQLIAMILAFLLAPAMAWAGTWCLKWVLKRSPLPSIGIYDALHWPVTCFIAAILISLAFSVGLSLPGNIATIVDPLVLLLIAATGAWIAMRAMNFVVENVAKRAVRHSHDDGAAQQSVLTTITIVRHVLILVIAAAALGIVLSQLSGFRSIGIALLSSAGAVALIVGIAGHAVLGNLIAGLQIALTQPFTLGDSVYIEDNYGTIEDITYTYVIVRTWDYRRMVIPIRFFIANWFENWSLRDTFLAKPIYLHVDYSASIDAIRQKFIELVEADEAWASDRDEPTVLAYEAKEESLIVRLTCAAKDPGTAWDLHCRIREQMIEWLQKVEDGRWLPRQRIDVARPSQDSGDDPKTEAD